MTAPDSALERITTLRRGAVDFELHLPAEADRAASQDEEWCEITLDGRRERIRFHDYDRIYSIPGLYERLIYEELGCESPQVVSRLLGDELDRRSIDPAGLRVLDLGAGNGIVGEELAEVGVDYLVGVDILSEAAEAAERDRPDVYDEYVVCDLTDGRCPAHSELRAHRLNGMTCVAALGFGDIPPEAFCAALRAISTPGWVAFTIKADFLSDGDESGFAHTIKELVGRGTLEIAAQQRYRHRYNWAGHPLEYVALVAEKRLDV